MKKILFVAILLILMGCSSKVPIPISPVVQTQEKSYILNIIGTSIDSVFYRIGNSATTSSSIKLPFLISFQAIPGDSFYLQASGSSDISATINDDGILFYSTGSKSPVENQIIEIKTTLN